MKRRRITKIGVLKTSLVAAIILFFVTFIFIIPFVIIMAVVSSFDTSGYALWSIPLVVIAPFLYGIFGFISTAITCLIYNLVAKWTGGIEVEIELVED